MMSLFDRMYFGTLLLAILYHVTQSFALTMITLVISFLGGVFTEVTFSQHKGSNYYKNNNTSHEKEN